MIISRNSFKVIVILVRQIHLVKFFLQIIALTGFFPADSHEFF